MTALSTEAANFGWLLDNFVRTVPGTRHTLVVSADGLLMAMSEQLDRTSGDQLAAIVSGMSSLTRGASRQLRAGEVRQAIVEGLDRATIAKSDLAGLPGNPVPLNNNLYVSNQDGYVDQAKATGIDYNVDKAKSTLDAAGWALNASTGFREKAGKELDVNFAVLTGVSASENEGLQAQKQLKALQWAVPAVTGALVAVTSYVGEQQRPSAVKAGVLGRLTPG